MHRSRRAALQAGALVALAELWALRHAWGAIGERLAIFVGVAALISGAVLLLTPWLHALTAGGMRCSLAVSLAAAPLLALPLAMAPTAQRLMGRAAALLLTGGIAALIVTIGRAHRFRMGPAVCTTIGLTNLVAQLALPRRLYPSLRVTLLVVGFAALGCALRRRGSRPSDAVDRAADATVAIDCGATARALTVTIAGAMLLLLVGRALVDVTANSRFVATVQAPAAGFVLDVVTSLMPYPPRFAPRPPRSAAPTTTAQPPPGASLHTPSASARDALGEAHLVIVTVDALRADQLRAESMPTLTTLAEHGIAFRRAYATAPSTGASITSLLTAHHPAHLDARPRTLGERLRAAGWFTACFYPAGLFFDGGGALQPYADAHFGFAWADTRTLDADALTAAALGRVRQLIADGEPRSFLWLHYFDPHEPYAPHGLPASASPLARYDAEVRAVDAALARLVAGLGTLARPTLLVVTGDHGEEFGEHGGAYHGSSLYDEQLRVPLVVSLIGRDVPPATVDTPASLVDVAPTVVALLGVAPLGGAVDGQDLWDQPRHDLFAAVHTRRMILRDDWKLIRDLRRDVDELYDLSADRGEQRNLVDTRSDVAAELRQSLDRWLNQSSTASLAAMVADDAAPSGERAAAARQLGAREAYAGSGALHAALDDADATVRAEAAIALAQLTDRAALPQLRTLLGVPAFADRAAVMLGRLRDPSAATRLRAICRRLPVAGDAAAATLRREAAHYLGFLGAADPSDAIESLFAAAVDPRVRGAAYVSAGRIAGRTHDAAAAARLRQRFAVEDRADARADLAWALGLADDRLAVPLLAAAAATEPPLRNAAESLIRLGALGDGRVGGLDFRCRKGAIADIDAPIDAWLAATSCTLTEPRAVYRGRPLVGGNVVLLRGRALGSSATLTIVIDHRPLPAIALGPSFHEIRLALPPTMVKPIAPMVKPLRIELLRDGAPVELDHLLLLHEVTARQL